LIARPEQITGRNREIISEARNFQITRERYQNHPVHNEKNSLNIEPNYDPSFTHKDVSISSSLLKGPRTLGGSDLFQSKCDSHGINRDRAHTTSILRNATDQQGSVLCEMDALTLRKCVVSSELFGVGLQVSPLPPPWKDQEP
jgi:hypothetical protein